MKIQLRASRQLKRLLLVIAPLLIYALIAAVPNWTIDGGGTRSRLHLVPAVAMADGPTTGLSAPGPMGAACGGVGTLASGILIQQAPCAANFKYCGVGYTNSGTPAVGALSCAPTVTTTTTGSPAATVTVSAVSLTQSSPAGAPTVAWWALF